MAKTATAPQQLKKGTKVVATADLRDVPEGTEGKVMMVTGLTWIRYWVRFANGVQLGQISRDKLATKADLEQQRTGGGTATEVATTDDAGADEVAADDGGGITTANGTFVAQKHIDRAKAARERLGA